MMISFSVICRLPVVFLVIEGTTKSNQQLLIIINNNLIQFNN